MDVLTLRNLHKAFGRQKVLQGIDLTVPQHSIFGFIGKNGAGKTTTMKTILGLEKADAGELYIMQGLYRKISIYAVPGADYRQFPERPWIRLH